MLKLNPDKEFVDFVRQQVKANNGYCPCQFEQTIDTRCPCKYMREQHDCYCGLYIDENENF